MTDRRSKLDSVVDKYVRETVVIGKGEVLEILVSRMGARLECSQRDGMEDGLSRAICEFDDDSFEDVTDLVADIVEGESREQVRRIALELLGEMAAQKRRKIAVEPV
jgi:hypothetical protein